MPEDGLRRPPKQERNDALIREYVENEGHSLASVGRMFGVSRQRVHEILVRHGVPRRPAPVRRKKKAVCQTCGAAIEGGGLKFCDQVCAGQARREWTSEAILETLRNVAAELGHSPTGADVQRSPELPALSTLQARFGSLNRALKEAGLKPRKPGVAVGQRGSK